MTLLRLLLATECRTGRTSNFSKSRAFRKVHNWQLCFTYLFRGNKKLVFIGCGLFVQPMSEFWGCVISLIAQRGTMSDWRNMEKSVSKFHLLVVFCRLKFCFLVRAAEAKVGQENESSASISFLLTYSMFQTVHSFTWSLRSLHYVVNSLGNGNRPSEAFCPFANNRIVFSFIRYVKFCSNPVSTNT